MLPSAKSYLIKGGFPPSTAAYMLTGCFLAGVVGIQVFSRFLHHYIPSNVVECDHTHDGRDVTSQDGDPYAEDQPLNGYIAFSEQTPLLCAPSPHRARSGTDRTSDGEGRTFVTAPLTRRPSLQKRLTNRVATFVMGSKTMCDESGPCHGYSDPCGHECFKAISQSPTRTRRSSAGPFRSPKIHRTATQPMFHVLQTPLENLDEDMRLSNLHEHDRSPLDHQSERRGRQDRQKDSYQRIPSHAKPFKDLENGHYEQMERNSKDANPITDASASHHHHVPANAFLSIGLQTSIAIALHKLPEGFITYATNHANPKLGFAVFMALFIHNITEGFAMALPLYLALGSRWKAMFWSSVLGGLSQPLGAGVAAFWFHVAGRGDMAPGERIYGCMFAVTAGIMSSVALQLFSESLGLTHNRHLCIAFAFIGMGILGFSFALTAE